MNLSNKMKSQLRSQAKFRLIGFEKLTPYDTTYAALVRRGLIDPNNPMILTPLGWQTCIDLNLLDEDEIEVAGYLAKGFKLRGRTDEEIESTLKGALSLMSNIPDNKTRCKICGGLYESHEVIGDNNMRGHRINSELAELNGVGYLSGVFHWYEPLQE